MVVSRCNRSDAATCPGCARRFRLQWVQLILSGMVDDADRDRPCHRFFFVTLTAPGAEAFGASHVVPHQKWRDTGHGRRKVWTAPAGALAVKKLSGDDLAVKCPCGHWHSSARARDLALAGVPITPEEYDYDAAARWNMGVSRLWKATSARLRRRLPTARFVVARELQARGLVHLHVLVRVPVADAVGVDAAALAADLGQTVAENPLTGEVYRWGPKTDGRRLDHRRAVAETGSYVAKSVGAYLTKTTGESMSPEFGPRQEHLRRLVKAASIVPSSSDVVEGIQVARAAAKETGGDVDLAVARRVAESRARAGVDATHKTLVGPRVIALSPDRVVAGRKEPGWSLTGETRRSQRVAAKEWVEAQQEGMSDEEKVVEYAAYQRRLLTTAAFVHRLRAAVFHREADSGAEAWHLGCARRFQSANEELFGGDEDV
ncbi:MAG: hypothetical protein ACFWTS_04575 [Pseudoclavibacter caeni]